MHRCIDTCMKSTIRNNFPSSNGGVTDVHDVHSAFQWSDLSSVFWTHMPATRHVRHVIADFDLCSVISNSISGVMLAIRHDDDDNHLFHHEFQLGDVHSGNTDSCKYRTMLILVCVWIHDHHTSANMH